MVSSLREYSRWRISWHSSLSGLTYTIRHWMRAPGNPKDAAPH